MGQAPPLWVQFRRLCLQRGGVISQPWGLLCWCRSLLGFWPVVSPVTGCQGSLSQTRGGSVTLWYLVRHEWQAQGPLQDSESLCRKSRAQGAKKWHNPYKNAFQSTNRRNLTVSLMFHSPTPPQSPTISQILKDCREHTSCLRNWANFPCLFIFLNYQYRKVGDRAQRICLSLIPHSA